MNLLNTPMWPTISDLLDAGLKRRQSIVRRQAEDICSRALANEEIVREYVRAKFVLEYHPPGITFSEVPMVRINVLGFWTRLRLAWLMLRKG